MSSSDKLKLPEIRFLTPEEQQQLTDLAEDIGCVGCLGTFL